MSSELNSKLILAIVVAIVAILSGSIGASVIHFDIPAINLTGDNNNTTDNNTIINETINETDNNTTTTVQKTTYTKPKTTTTQQTTPKKTYNYTKSKDSNQNKNPPGVAEGEPTGQNPPEDEKIKNTGN